MDDKIVLVNTYELLAHERVDIFHAIYILCKMILTGEFGYPLLVDKTTNTILDGHHRSYSAHRLGLVRVPCYYIDYLGDESITVTSRRPDIFVDKNEVLKMALSHTVFPEKTTRHKYKMPEFKTFTLKELKG